MTLIEPIIRNIKKYKTSEFFKAKFYFAKYYD